MRRKIRQIPLSLLMSRLRDSKVIALFKVNNTWLVIKSYRYNSCNISKYFATRSRAAADRGEISRRTISWSITWILPIYRPEIETVISPPLHKMGELKRCFTEATAGSGWIFSAGRVIPGLSRTWISPRQRRLAIGYETCREHVLFRGKAPDNPQLSWWFVWKGNQVIFRSL